MLFRSQLEVAVAHAFLAGRGIRQFADGTPLDLALIETRQFDGGIVLLRYRTATR